VERAGFLFLSKKRTHLKLPISQAQKPEYAYNCQIRTENTKVSKTVKILSVCITELVKT
jgi:hypothetical protein